MPSSSTRVVVIGGGVSGLTAAYRLFEISREKNTPMEIHLLEALPRLGGVINSHHRDKFLLEDGPDSFIIEKPWALDLCKRLGLGSDLVGTNPKNRRSFVAKGNKLHPTPPGFYLMGPSKIKPFLTTPLLGLSAKLRVLMEMGFRPRRAVDDESVASFVRRHFGGEVLKRIAQPMIGGIYSADPENLSLRATFPQFLEMEEKFGSVIRALQSRENDSPLVSGDSEEDDGAGGARYGLFASLKGGMSTLIRALAAKIPKENIHLKRPAYSLQKDGPQWVVTLATGERVRCDGVIIALPAPAAAKLLKGVDSSMAEMVENVLHGSAATIHFAYPIQAVAHALDGFGFVVPSVEKRAISACTFSNVKFPGRAPNNYVLLRAFVAPHLVQNVGGDELTRQVQKDVADYLGISSPPLWNAYRRYLNAMPHYAVGHLSRVEAIEWRMKTVPRVKLAGNYFRGVGLPECIRSAYVAAEDLSKQLAFES